MSEGDWLRPTPSNLGKIAEQYPDIALESGRHTRPEQQRENYKPQIAPRVPMRSLA
jgi:hypothetical protein